MARARHPLLRGHDLVVGVVPMSARRAMNTGLSAPIGGRLPLRSFEVPGSFAGDVVQRQHDAATRLIPGLLVM